MICYGSFVFGISQPGGGVELSVLEGDFGKCRIYEIALYRMVQAVWRKRFW